MKCLNTVLLIKDQRACQRCWRCETLYYIINKGSKAIKCVCCFYTTLYRVMLFMSEVSKVYCTLYTVASHPYQEGRLFEPSILGV